ncbi:MAG: hypothetical protein DI598_04170 [Pseudopedobacter saltans]|uniref:Uncharacterized protein n=1 Tax=Pseudopedobacter saltans TaxID=151895 RepID=A0A2W5F896_9SPHI|nr:MAG: hypothetical protein DI598_04170 [Pseudopedobacter saltans]
MSLLATACKSNDSATENKIDFTQSYENAALALTSAQNNFATALESHDTTKIKMARMELQTATTNYVNSKNSLIQHGGAVKQEYESSLTKSEETLSKTSNTPTASSDSVIGGKVGQTISSTAEKIENIKNTGQAATTSTLDKADKAIQNISAKKAKAQQDIQNAKDHAQKNAQETNEKTKKLKDDINNLFK